MVAGWGQDVLAAYPTAGGLDKLYVMGANGVGKAFLGVNGYGPSWQPSQSYVRPKGATPMRIALVTANTQCTSANSIHGAPLAFPSCALSQLSSNRLTVGTGDSNGKDAFMQAFIRLDVAGGDVHVRAFLNDIFNKDLSDYTGGLRAHLPIQITDKSNAPSPLLIGAGTAEAFPFEFDLGCAATPADPSMGSDCALDTTSMRSCPAPSARASARSGSSARRRSTTAARTTTRRRPPTTRCSRCRRISFHEAPGAGRAVHRRARGTDYRPRNFPGQNGKIAFMRSGDIWTMNPDGTDR